MAKLGTSDADSAHLASHLPSTRRFDRPASGQRLHMVSLPGAIEVPPHAPTLDYDGFLHSTMAITRDVRSVDHAFQRMVFNLIACNRDDQSRQHAYLMYSPSVWRLAPAFDLTFSTGPGGEHYFATAGEGSAPTRAHVEHVGKTHGIPKVHRADHRRSWRCGIGLATPRTRSRRWTVVWKNGPATEAKLARVSIALNPLASGEKRQRDSACLLKVAEPAIS